MDIILAHTPCLEFPAKPWLLTLRAGTLSTEERFESEEQAKNWRQELEAIAPDIERVVQINRLLAGTGYNAVDLVEIASAARACSTASRFTDVTAALLTACKPRIHIKTVDALSPETLANYRIIFGVLDRHFGEKTCDAITTTDFLVFLQTLKDNFGQQGKASTHTKRTYSGIMRMVLLYAGIKDPLRRLPKFQDKRRKVRFYRVVHATQIFAATPEWERAVVAIAMFGLIPLGVACKLTPSCIKFEKQTITIPADISPDKREIIITTEMWVDGRFLPGLPSVLWEWLRRFIVQPTDPENLQIRLKRATGFWIQDGLRRSAATYYSAMRGDKAAATLLSHAGEMLTAARFVGEASVKEAEAFFALVPDKITFDRGHAPYGYIRDLPKEEFERLLWVKSMPEIAKEFAVSTNTVFRYKQDLGLSGPPPAYWTKKRGEARRKARDAAAVVLIGAD